MDDTTSRVLEILINEREELNMADMHKISVMISEDELQAKIAELGEKISADYEGKEVKLICILKEVLSSAVNSQRELQFL